MRAGDNKKLHTKGLQRIIINIISTKPQEELMHARLSHYLSSFVLILALAATSSFAAIPTAPQLSAKSYILMDYASGEVIAEKNSHDRVPPASLTKLMTAHIVEQELAAGKIKLTDEVPISEKAWKAEGSRMFVEVNKTVSVEELLKGVIVQSGNDASIALAEYIAGTEAGFADLMNQEAQRLGMQDSHFVNATGLPDDNQYSSAYDMAILARTIIKESPSTYPMYKEKWFDYGGIRQPNRNRLLWWDESVDGLKTGHTESAGYCLVASAEKNGMRLISAVMGTDSDNTRTEESKQLMTYGFRFFTSKEIYPANTVLAQQRIWKGQAKEVNIGLIEPLQLVVPADQGEDMEAVITLNKVIEAPVTEGQTLGTLQVMSGNTVLVEKPLVALQTVDRAGWFGRLWDSILLFFHNLLN